MAKVTAYIPEPAPEYEAENQRQIIEALATMQQQLNFSFQQDLKNEQDAFNYFLSWPYNIKIKVLNKAIQAKLPCSRAQLMEPL